MRILLICQDSPLNRAYGGGLRTNYLWEALKRVGSVSALVMEPAASTELSAAPGVGEIGRLRFKKPMVPWVTAETRKIRGMVTQLLAGHTFDVVVVRHLRMAMLVRGSVEAPVILDDDDVDKSASTIGRSPAQRLFDFVKTTARRAITRRAIRGYAHVWFVKPADMAKFLVRSASVIPNLANAPAVLLPRAPANPPRVLMVGKFGYAPNTEGVEFFIGQVLPALRKAVPGSRLRLVGQCPPDLAARWRAVAGVDVDGFVDDLAPVYAGASLVVAPVFSGGGTQIKVLEALGHECGTVVSGFAAAGFAPNLRDGEHLLVARDAGEWVAQCLKLIASPAQAERLGRAGRAVVLQAYSFEGMAREVRSTIERLVEPSR